VTVSFYNNLFILEYLGIYMALSGERLECVLHLFDEMNGNVNEIIELYTLIFEEYITAPTIRKYLRRSGKCGNLGSGGHRQGLSDEDVQALYKKHGGDVQQMANEGKIKPATLETRCYKLHLKPKNVPGVKKKPKRSVVCERYYRP